MSGFEILILNDVATPDSGSAFVASMSAAALAAREHKVTYLAAAGKPDPALEDSGIRTISLGQELLSHDPDRRRAALQGIRNAAAERAVTDILADKDPARTIVHVHGWARALSGSVIPAARRTGAPVVCTLHDYGFACPNGTFYDYAKGEVCPKTAMSWDCLRTNCDKRRYAHKLYRFTRSLADRSLFRALHHLSHAVFVSAFSREVMRPYLPAGLPASVIRNPIRAGRAGPVHVARNRRFLYLSRLDEDKGALVAARAAAAAGAEMVFVGEGTEASRIKALCPTAVLTGWLDHDELLAQMEGCRALVFPSKLLETQGLAVQEAAARGLPAIVAAQGAAASFVTDGTTGMHFARGDADDLARCLRACLDDGWVARLGSAAYEAFWSDPPVLAPHVDALESLYAQLLG